MSTPAAPRVERRGVRRRTLLALLALALLGVALAQQLRSLGATHEFNHSLATGDWATAATHESAYGRLAHAYRLHRDGRLDEAVTAYGQFSEHDPPVLRHSARFDLASLYLQRAQHRDIEDDTRVPLVELAKQLLREVLREQPHDWDARYNLSVALLLVPDVEIEELAESRNLERAPRAPQATPAYEQLP